MMAKINVEKALGEKVDALQDLSDGMAMTTYMVKWGVAFGTIAH